MTNEMPSIQNLAYGNYTEIEPFTITTGTHLPSSKQRTGGARMSDSSISRGPSFLCLLTIVFIALKLTDVIAWSWWWVLAPLWIPIAAGIVFTLLLLLFVWVWVRTP